LSAAVKKKQLLMDTYLGRRQFIEEGSVSALDACGGIQVHRRGPALPVLALRSTVLCPQPFIKAELNPFLVDLAGRSNELCKCDQLSPGKLTPAGGNQSRYVKSTRERPDSAVMIFTRLIVPLVPGPPVRVIRPNIRE
jgi:hypothetical protein